MNKRTIKKPKTLSNKVKYKISNRIWATILAGLMINAAGKLVNPELQVVYVDDPELQYGMVYAWGENKPISIFGNMLFLDQDGTISWVKEKDVTKLSDSFRKSDFKEFNTVYKVKNYTELVKGKKYKFKANIPKSSYVLGKEEPDKDGYIEIVTEDGKKGKVHEEKLNSVVTTDISKKGKKDYEAVNGEVFGIDCTKDSVSSKNFESILKHEMKLSPIGNIDDPRVEYAILKAGAFGYGKHRLALKNGMSEDQLISGVINQIKLCLKNNKPYGLYLYSTCTNVKEADEEARYLCKLLKQVKKSTKTLPFLPIAIDVELGGGTNDIQYKAAKENPDSVSYAKAHLFNKLMKEYPDLDFMLYTERNVTEQSRIININTIMKHIKNMDKMNLWWVSPMNTSKNNQELHANDGNKVVDKSDGKAEIVMKQIALNVAPGIDMDVAREEWIKPYLEKFYKWNEKNNIQEYDVG